MTIQQLGNRDIYLKFDDSYLEGLHAVQGETGRTYTFTLLDGEGRLVDASPYTLTMTVSIKGGINQSKARGTSDGKFTVAITPDMISRYGRADVQLTVSDDNRTLASLIGNLEIERNISFDDGEGINLLLDFSKVKQALDSLGEIREEANKSLNETIEERDKACECATKACECASVAQEGAKKAEKVREEADDIFSSEADRKAAENKRVEAENLRADSESTRQSQESTRKSQEVTRQSQEQGRNSAESVRQEAEDERKSDEDTRVRQERARESQEDTRKLQESERESQEALRQGAENARVSAEDLRKEAEIERASTFEAWDKTMEGVIPPATNISPGVVLIEPVTTESGPYKVPTVGTFDNAIAVLKGDVAGKQDNLIAGENIQIDDATNTISATDTITTINGKTGAISKDDIVALGIPSQDTVYTHPPGTNPHGTTKSDVGLGNVTNDKQMPISGGVLENYREKLVALSGTSTAINLSLGNVFTHTLSGNTTYSITNAVNGQAHSFTLIINMGSTVRTLTFPASVKWQGGEIPDMSTANKTYVLTFMTVDGGTTWLGMFGGEF